MPKTKTDTPKTRTTGKADRTYDAIVIGGGHNGLTNGAYLAKAGLRTLILERRHLVGGAAITEELRPGFWFTTFSYALSLLRPDIVQELELTKHGFMPILMPTTFCPKEDGDYLLLGQDHGENLKEIGRHSPHDADAYDAFNHDVNKVLQAIKPLLDQAPPDIFSDDPEELVALAALGGRFRKLDKKVLHDAVRLLTGSAADFLDDYFESDILKGYLASSAIIGTKVGPYSQGSGLVLLYHILGEHDGEFGAWSFHKRRQRRLHPGPVAGGPGVRGGDPARVAGRQRDHEERPGDRGGPGRRDRVPRADRRLGARPAPDVPRAGRAARAADRPGRDDPAVPLPGHLVEGQLRARRRAALPGSRRPDRPVPRVHQHRPVDDLPRAGLRRREVRLVLAAAVSRLRGPVDGRPGHGPARQGGHELLRPVHPVPAPRERLGHREGASRRHGPGHARVVLPGLRRPRPPARGADPARHRADGRPLGGEHLRRRVPRPADVLLPPRARAGRSTGPRSTATTSAAPAPTRAAA